MARITDLRAAMIKGAFRVMQSPRFVRVLQDRRVLTFLVEGMSLRAHGRVLLRGAGETVARALGLATLEDLRAVEQDLRDRGAPSGRGPERPLAPTQRDLRPGEVADADRDLAHQRRRLARGE